MVARVVPFRRKNEARSKGLKRVEPNILLVGTPLQTRPIEITLEGINAATLTTQWHDHLADEIGEATEAVVLIAPLPKARMPAAMRRLRGQLDRHNPALFGVVGENLSDSRARRIYDAGATAVFQWPQEAKLFPYLIAEMLAFEMVRGKTKGPDNALKRSIEAHLRSIGGLRRGIHFAVHEGVVSLWGLVDSLWRKAQLEDIISRIPGVLNIVTRDLQVAPSGLSDRDIAGKVRRLLRISSDIDPTTLSVSVRNGIVTLAGSARDREEIDRLKEITRNAKGARGMENLVTISRLQKEKDHIVSRRINGVLSRLYPHKDVSISVFGGVAVLSGQVELLKARMDIEEIVRRDRGVERVINKIAVD